MTLRSVMLGLLLGLGISVATYFNDYVIQQTMLIGNHLPISVFGFLVVLLLAINPVLRRIGHRLALKPGEVGVVAALGLAACGWPGSNFYRGFAAVTALPAHWNKTGSRLAGESGVRLCAGNVCRRSALPKGPGRG